jgi:predicted MFS family arabinose efflux permease
MSTTIPPAAEAPRPRPAAEAPETRGPAEAPPTPDARRMLWLTNVSHANNHFQNNMITILYPAIMADLGFDYAQLGILTAVRVFLGNAMQLVYGMITPFVSRTRILAWGNFGIALGTLVSGLVASLAGYFPRRRGMILALNNSIANVGSLCAPLAAGALLYLIGWRNIFLLVAAMSLVLGVVYLFVADRGSAASVGRKARFASGLTSYKRVLRHRNIMLISLVMMVGAAGRGDGIQTYLAPHLVNDLSLTVFIAGLALTAMQAGSIVGPIVLGWLSDRYSRKGVLQLSLLLSAGATWWLAYQGGYIPSLMLSMITFGAVTTSRNSLTQALIADSLDDTDRDAAFSVYYFIGFISDPIWALVGGFLMQGMGFEFAFSRLAVSYLVGMLLVFFIVDPRTQGQAAS